MQEPNQLDCWSRGHTAWTQDCYVRFGSKKEAMEESIRCPIRTVASSGAPCALRQQRRACVLDGVTVPVRIQKIESEDVLRVSPVCVATPSPPVCVLRLSIATPSKSSARPAFQVIVSNLLLELHVTEATGETIDIARGRRPSPVIYIAIVWRASHRRARSSSTQEITRGCVCVDRQRET